MGRDVLSHPGPIPASHRTGMGPNFFSWDGMGPNLCGMGAPGPVPALCQDRDGTRSWWDGSSHPGPTASLTKRFKQLILFYQHNLSGTTRSTYLIMREQSDKLMKH